MVKINISNRTMYFLITLGIISIFAVGVFAIAPNPGHDVSQIDGACQSDGDNCQGIGDFNLDVGLYQTGDDICYTSSASSSCVTQTATCSAASETIVEIIDGLVPDCASLLGGGILGLDPDELDSLCLSTCQIVPICNGDITPFSCGATIVGYTDGSYLGCVDTGFFEVEVSCDCSAPAQPYQQEQPSTSTDILCLQQKDQGVTTTSQTFTDYQNTLNCKNLGVHDFCVLASCEMHDIDTPPEDGRCYITGSAGSLWQVCSFAATSGDDGKARAGAYCVDIN